MKTRLFVACSMMALIACGPGSRGEGDGDDDDDGSGSGSSSGEMKRCNKMDIMFVVDDSPSMDLEQDNLATNFPMFASLLDNYVNADGDHIDYRVAVTTTGRDIRYTTEVPGLPTIPTDEKGANGAFRDNCDLSKRWLEPTDANMSTVLSCRAKVGDKGPSDEMPLLMPKWALADRMADGTNTGFTRDDALLAVVTLTDEDDSSTTQNDFVVRPPSSDFPVDWNPTDLVQYFDTVKGGRSRWASAVIAGDGDCSSDFGSAVDATRLKEFVNQANSQGTTQAVFSSICAGDLTIGLQQALELFQDACGGIIL